MNTPVLKQIWSGLKELTQALKTGRYWTERRDACEALRDIARQSAYYLQAAAADKDADIAHWGRQACRQIAKDLGESIEQRAHAMQEAMEQYLEGTVPAESRSDETPGARPEPAAAEAAPATTAADDRAPKSPEDESTLSTAQLIEWVEQFAARAGSEFKRREFGASFVLPAPDGRRQTLYVDVTCKEDGDEPAVLFYSICGEAAPEAFEWALKANARLSRGAFGVIPSQGRLVLVLLMRRRLAEVRLDTLEPKLLYLARKADWAEARLKEKDTL